MRDPADFEVQEDWGTWIIWDAISQEYLKKNNGCTLRFDTKDEAKARIEEECK